MSNSDTMIYLMIGIMAVSGYIFLVHAVTGRISNKKSLPVLAVILLVIYAALVVPLLMILSEMGEASFVLLAVLILLSCMALFALLYGMFRYFRELNKSMLVLFVLYLLAVGYFTIFNREEGHSRAIMLQFDSIRDAIRGKTFEPLQHALLNAVMFVPIGVLFPLIWPQRLAKIVYVGTLGLMLSTIIEASQMFLLLGQCDVEDIAANTLGALIGVLLYKVYALIFVRDEDLDEDDEDEEEEEA